MVVAKKMVGIGLTKMNENVSLKMLNAKMVQISDNM